MPKNTVESPLPNRTTLQETLRPTLEEMVNKRFAQYGVSNIRELMEKGDEGLTAGVQLIEELVRALSEAAKNSDLPLGDTATAMRRLLTPTKFTDAIDE